MKTLRELPSVDSLLQRENTQSLIFEFGRRLVVDCTREVLEEIRRDQKSKSLIPDLETMTDLIRCRIDRFLTPISVPVINASGVVLHTNLGRAPLSEEACAAMMTQASEYCSLEYNLEQGTRGNRTAFIEQLITYLTGAEEALVVNNNAAAVYLVLAALVSRKKVAIARSQLVEIGGGFRVPDVIRHSGAKLLEVGTTNRIHAEDYEIALQEGAVALLRAHHSNYKIIGFTQELSLKDMVRIAEKYSRFVIDDLGSGALLDTSRFGLPHEPMVQESMDAGAGVICFSGDKLLGGPQAGIIIGKREFLQKVKRHPFARAVRADKITIAALTETLIHYVKGEAETQIPIWQMIARSQADLERQCGEWVSCIATGSVAKSLSTVGGGSLPTATLPTSVLALSPSHPVPFMKSLRMLKVPIIARLEDDRVLFDPRTVLPKQEAMFLEELISLTGKGNL